jgi:hypothetical protein
MTPIRLFIDFDGTLTTHDTISQLSSIPYALSLPHKPTLPPFSDFTEAYLSDLQRHNDAYRPVASERTTLAQELEYLRSLRPVEQASIERIEAAGVFRGVSSGDLATVASRMVNDGSIKLRKGWLDIADDMIEAYPYPQIVVCSVNWSRRWVNTIIQHGVRLQGRSERGLLCHFGFVVNDLEETSEVCTGSMGRYFDQSDRSEGGIWTSGDKARVMRDFLNDGTVNPAVDVYIGDSVTDLECLMIADVGICMRGNEDQMGSAQKQLIKVLERIGVECVWIGDWTGSRTNDKLLVWARDFGEIRNSTCWKMLLEESAKACT